MKAGELSVGIKIGDLPISITVNLNTGAVSVNEPAARPAQRPDPAPEAPAKPSLADRAGVVEDLRGFMEERSLTQAQASKMIGCSENSVHNWLAGKSTPQQSAADKITAAIAAAPPVKKPPGQLPQQPTPMQAAIFLQRTVAAWQREAGIDHAAAAARLGITRAQLLRLLQAVLPVPGVIEAVSAHLPAVHNELERLLAARRMYENSCAS